MTALWRLPSVLTTGMHGSFPLWGNALRQFTMTGVPQKLAFAPWVRMWCKFVFTLSRKREISVATPFTLGPSRALTALSIISWAGMFSVKAAVSW